MKLSQIIWNNRDEFQIIIDVIYLSNFYPTEEAEIGDESFI